MLALIGWLIIGGLAGWIASKFMGTDAQQGIFLNIVVGIIGAGVGGFALKLFGSSFDNHGKIFTFITAVIGACIFLAIFKALTKKSGKQLN